MCKLFGCKLLLVQCVPTKTKGNNFFNSTVFFSSKYPATRSSRQLPSSVLLFLSQFYLFYPLGRYSQTSINTDKLRHTEPDPFWRFYFTRVLGIVLAGNYCPYSIVQLCVFINSCVLPKFYCMFRFRSANHK